MNRLGRLFALVVLCSGVLSAIAETISLTNLSQQLQEAEKCNIRPPDAAKELAWLEGKWVCSDRVIRECWLGIYDYVWWNTIELESAEDIKDRFLGYTNLAGFLLYVTHTNSHGETKLTSSKPARPTLRHVGIVGSDFLYNFGPGGSDPFWLKRERSARPNWFILEHQDEGHVFLFRRMEQSDSDEAGDEEKEAPLKSAEPPSPRARTEKP